MSKLAIHGGEPIRKIPFPSQNTMDHNEMKAVCNIMLEGRLSGYRANWGSEFWGGPAIQALEKQWQKKFNTKHAIPVNSCTSGLQIACRAIGLEPGEEVIVTPYSMTCSATAPLLWGATPVFADIEPDYFCLDPKSVEEQIGPRTKAIIAVSLFGQPYDLRINEIAKKHNIIVIEDAAQAIGSYYYDSTGYPTYAGTLGDIGIFSFNYGKHITCGEGGMIVTNDDELAMKCRLLMNHAEAVVNDMYGFKTHTSIIREKWNLKSLFGFNMRMTELQAVIISEQLKKFDDLLNQRRNNVQTLSHYLEQIPAISFSKTRSNCTHSYYVCSFKFDDKKADNLHRDDFINAVKAELPPRIGRENEDVQIGSGYIKPLYLFPIFQEMMSKCRSFAKFPITNYIKGSCPVCEDLWENKLFLTLYHSPMSTMEDCMDVVKAFQKVWDNRRTI